MHITAEIQPNPRRRALAVFRIVMLFFFLFLVLGCDQTDPQSSSSSSSSSATVIDPIPPIRARLADAFLQGVDYVGVRIEADDFDPITQILSGVRVTTGQSLLSAARAEIKVNYNEKTAQLILYDVVTAGAPTSSDAAAQGNPDLEGAVLTYDRLELDPFSIEN